MLRHRPWVRTRGTLARPRGSLRSVSHVSGMDKFLSSQRVLYKDFGRFAESLSSGIKDHSKALAEQAGRPEKSIARS